MGKVIGLTGGIASGKSAATSILRDLGFLVIDADVVVHELQKPGGKLYQAIFADFGPDFFDEKGCLKRVKLANLVFGDKLAYKRLADLQNDIIREELETRLRSEMRASDDRVNTFFMDIPLLFEEHYESLFDEIWLVTVPEEVQIRRLMSRSNLTEEEARARIAHQMPLKEKAALANVILDNSTSLNDLRLQILDQVKRL